jgi:hypothetical protein
MPSTKRVRVAQGVEKTLMQMPDGSYAEVVVSGGNMLVDSTWAYPFNPDVLPCSVTYDGNNHQTSITYGPDQDGRYFRQTSTWSGDLWMGDTAWVVVTP